MEKHQKNALLSRCALFGAALIWGSSFFVVKNTVDVFPPNLLLAFRFTIGGLLLALVFWKKLRLLNREYLWKGGLTGILLFAAYSMQTIGITDTTPGKNAFLTAVYCVIVPFLNWLVSRERPDGYNWAAALLCITGIGLVSLTEGFTMRFGDVFTLIGGFFYAAHMIAVARFGREKDPFLLTIVQFGSAAVCSWIAGLCFETIPSSLSTDSLLGLLFLAVFASAGALLLQNVGQKGTSATSASIILSLESVFGVLFSVLIYGEALTARLVLGFALIFAAVITSETKLSFLRRSKPAHE